MIAVQFTVIKDAPFFSVKTQSATIPFYNEKPFVCGKPQSDWKGWKVSFLLLNMNMLTKKTPQKTVLQKPLCQHGQALNSVHILFDRVSNETPLPKMSVQFFTDNMESCHSAGEHCEKHRKARVPNHAEFGELLVWTSGVLHEPEEFGRAQQTAREDS